jgi:uncharacterized phage protein gp47/JayE
MSVGTPDSEQTVIDNISVDVARSAPDSNPYLKVHWLASFINGMARRIFDFDGDLVGTEARLMPDTADETTAPRWGGIFGKTLNPASQATGRAIAQGVAGGFIPVSKVFAAGGNEYTATSSATIADNVLSVSTLTRSGAIATATTPSDHNLASEVPVTILGAVETEYNVADAAITVTGSDTFTYAVAGSPSFPATGTITCEFTSASVPIISTGFGSSTNLSLDTPLAMQSPEVDVNDTVHVDFGAIGGGTDAEDIDGLKSRYLDKVQNPVAHFNAADITDKAKEVPGVTRVFVEPAGTEIGTVAVTSITRSGSIATAVTTTPHGFESGQRTTPTGADQAGYNLVKSIILVIDASTFCYIVDSGTVSPATGTITTTTTIPLGQVRTFFMRDDDANSIPSASEVATVKAKVDEILPANTSTDDNIVLAPTAVPTDFTFTELSPNTSTMRTAVTANLEQFFDEQVSVGVDIDEALYNAAIANTVDTETGDTIVSFTTTTSGDIYIDSGEIGTLGNVTYS